jgi:hypothetical protein
VAGLFALAAGIVLFGAGSASYALVIEVTASGSTYRVTTDGGATLYSGTSFTAALQASTGNGNRTINVRVGGRTSQQVRIFANTTFNWRTTSYWDSAMAKASSGAGAQLYAKNAAGIVIDGVKMNTSNAGPGYGIRLSNCAGARITNIDMDWRNQNVYVGMRIDNESAGLRTNGVTISSVNVRNTPYGSESHGVETYGIDNVNISNVTCSNLGGCAVLVQGGGGGSVGTVRGTRVGNGTGYATMRFANGYSNCTVSSVISDGQDNRSGSPEGGRGLFILDSSGITVNSVNITNQASQGIYIQNGSNNRVLSGSVSWSVAPRITNSPGSSINVTTSNVR